MDSKPVTINTNDNKILVYKLCCISKYSKICRKRPLKKETKIGFKDRSTLNAGQMYCKCIYFRPSLSYLLPLSPLFCLFVSGCLRQVLLYRVHLPNLLSVPFNLV